MVPDEDDVGGDDRPRAALDTHIWCEVKIASKENLIDGHGWMDEWQLVIHFLSSLDQIKIEAATAVGDKESKVLQSYTPWYLRT